jgi:hypothetical protein
MTIDFQKVADVIEKAPKGIKNLMFSVELGDRLFEIATTNGVEEEEPYLQMVDEVGYVILGLKSPSSFVDSLVQMGISKDLATSIFSEIDGEIFSKLKKFEGGEIYRPTKKGPVIDGENILVVKKIRTAIKDKNREALQKELNELPKTTQDLLFGNVWEERTAEIAEKYSLNEPQTDSLVNNVLFILINKAKKETLLETVVKDLGISQMLAEQIMEDLEVRVFEYAFKTIQNQDKKVSSSEKSEDDDLPEIRPIITPMIEPEEKVRVRPIPVGFTGATPKPVPVPQPSASGPRQSAPELIQRPVSVPRYTAVPMEEEKNSSQGLAVSSNEGTGPTKETAPHQSASGQQTSATPQPVPEPVKKYAVDPYREPLE